MGFAFFFVFVFFSVGKISAAAAAGLPPFLVTDFYGFSDSACSAAIPEARYIGKAFACKHAPYSYQRRRDLKSNFNTTESSAVASKDAKNLAAASKKTLATNSTEEKRHVLMGRVASEIFGFSAAPSQSVQLINTQAKNEKQVSSGADKYEKLDGYGLNGWMEAVTYTLLNDQIFVYKVNYYAGNDDLQDLACSIEQYDYTDVLRPLPFQQCIDYQNPSYNIDAAQGYVTFSNTIIPRAPLSPGVLIS